MTKIQKLLFEQQDKEYADFTRKLNPSVDPKSIIGVRIPKVRQIAKQVKKMPDECEKFLNTLPHKYFDENMLHSILLSTLTKYDEALARVEEFLPHVNNWATCDTMTPKAFKKNRETKKKLFPHVKKWCAADEEFAIRFGLVALMNLYLDDENFKPEYLQIPLRIKSDAYYVKMGIAWFYATSLTDQWDATLPIFKKPQLSPEKHNKSIQKARESRKITKEQKEYLLTLKV